MIEPSIVGSAMVENGRAWWGMVVDVESGDARSEDGTSEQCTL